VCRGELKVEEWTVENKCVKEGIIRCKHKHWFPIIDFIPRLLNDDLKKEILLPKKQDFFRKYQTKLPDLHVKQKQYNKSRTADIFGYEWKEFDKLYDVYENQFKEWTYPISKKFFKGKFILDAGCGTGRHIFYSRKYGCKEIIGVDLSEAVEVAYKNNLAENVHIIHADILDLPFKEGIFDFIYSIGVLHHLPEPKKGFLGLLKFGKKDSKIAVWLYGAPSWILKYFFDPLRKKVISKLPTRVIKLIALFITMVSFTLAKLIYGPLNRLTKLAKYLPLNFTLNYLSKFNFKIVYSMMYDIISPPNQFYLTRQDMEEWFIRDELKNPVITGLKHSWTGNADIK